MPAAAAPTDESVFSIVRNAPAAATAIIPSTPTLRMPLFSITSSPRPARTSGDPDRAREPRQRAAGDEHSECDPARTNPRDARGARVVTERADFEAPARALDEKPHDSRHRQRDEDTGVSAGAHRQHRQ